MIQKLTGCLLVVLAIVLAVVWNTRIGFHETVTPKSVGVFVNEDDYPGGPQLVVNADETRPDCSRLDRRLSLKQKPLAGGGLTVEVGSFTYGRNLPLVQPCSERAARTRVGVGEITPLPAEWFSNPGTHDINVIVDKQPNLVRFSNTNGQATLKVVNGTAVRTSESLTTPSPAVN